MTTLAIIPARLGSTRLPRKPLRLLAGLPLIVRVWQRVAALGIADALVVAADSDDVAHECRAHGIGVVMTSPTHASGTDRVAEVAARPEFARFDVILNVQGDEPFVSGSAVRGAVGKVVGGAFDIGTAAAIAGREILSHPDTVKLVADDLGRAMYFSRAPIPFLRDASDGSLLDSRVWHHLGVYVYTRDALSRWVRLPPHPLEVIERLEQLRPLAAGMTIGVAFVDEPAQSGIDTEDDLARANSDWTAFTENHA